MMALSDTLSRLGIKNEVSFIECDEAGLEAALASAQANYDQIRIGGSLRGVIWKHLTEMPAQIFTIKSIDALVRADDRWWPNNYLFEGLIVSIARDLNHLDLTGAVLILGSGGDAKTVAAAFSRIGFSRFSISDRSIEAVEELIVELRRNYFNGKFQAIPGPLITQVPSIHSVAVNTIAVEQDGFLDQFFYMNFLKADGAWLDISFEEYEELAAEARDVGAFVEPAARIFACADRAWAQAAFGVDITQDPNDQSIDLLGVV
jgi:shikimate 5-dehydrogenase